MTLNRVLCVDDDANCREAWLLHFEDVAKTIDIAEGYESAMKQIRQNRYDLIVLDSLEGECFRIYEDAKGIPQGDIVICSANFLMEEKAKECGIPFCKKSMQDLEKLIAKYR